MFTKLFWLEATERALKTFSQIFISLLAADEVFNAFTADWQTLLGISLGATFLSYLTSILSLKVGHTGSPSLVSSDG
jgi:hypothetical protein